MNSSLIIGTPDAKALKKRMDLMEAQVSALIDAMNATEGVLKALADEIAALSKDQDKAA